MVKYYFKLQLTLLSRKLEAFGLAPYLGFIAIPVVFTAISFLFFLRIPFFEYVYPALCIIALLSLKEKNKDRFLQFNCSKTDFRLIRFIEHLLVAGPFILFMLYKQYFLLAGILLVVSGILSFLKLSLMQAHIPTPFSKTPFEFPVGFRRSILLYAGVYFVLLMALRVDNFNLGLFTLGCIYIICLGNYYLMEPAYYVSIFNDSPQSFLLRKLKTGLIYSTLSALPIICILIIVYTHHYLPVFAVILLGTMLMCITIITKYSSFPDSMSVGDAILLGISIICPPLLLYTLPKLYKKSIDHLSPLLP